MCARALVNANASKIGLSVINVNDKPVKLHQSTPLATL